MNRVSYRSGKFSRGAKFPVFRGLADMRENKNHEKFQNDVTPGSTYAHGATGRRRPLAESLGSSRRRDSATLGLHLVSFHHCFHDSMAITTLLARWGCKRVNWGRGRVLAVRENKNRENLC